MTWAAETRVRRCAMGTVAVGAVGALLLGVSFGTTSWIVFPPGHFILKSHTLYMGLVGDRACVSGQCGIVPNPKMRQDNITEWNIVLALMCTTISITFMATAMNIIVLFMPKRVFTLFAALFWCCAGAMNMVSVIIFWHLFASYEQRMSWSYWVSMISTILFYLVGLTLSVFACCHHWTKPPSRREPEDPVVVAPPPVVAYRSDGDDPDTPKYDFSADPDMQPYAFENRTGGGHSAAYHM